jgi:hypothetical protein
MSDSILYCSICGKPISIEEAKTDGYGHAVHETCIVIRLASMPHNLERSPSNP